jgi:hypothetical protein
MNEYTNCFNCQYEVESQDDLDWNGYCQNCSLAFENGRDTGFMEALQQVAGILPDVLNDANTMSAERRYALFARLLNG